MASDTQSHIEVVMDRLTKTVKWVGVCLLVAAGGMSLGAFLIEWVRTPSTGWLLGTEGRECLGNTFGLLPWGENLVHRWEVSRLHHLTAHFPGMLWSGGGAIAVWFFSSLACAWQNSRLFPRALFRIGLTMGFLLGYLPLAVFEHNPDRMVPQWITIFPIAFTLFAATAVFRRIRRDCLPLSSWAPDQVTSWECVPAAIVWIFAANRFFDWFSISSLRHDNFASQAYDLGLMSHIMKNLVTGDGLTSSLLVSGGGFLGHHFSPILYLVSPLYFFCPHPETLLLVQSAAVAFAAVPLYLFAKKYLCSPWTAAGLALTFLFMPGLSEGVFSDFHAICLAPFLVFWLAWESLRGESNRFWIPLTLVLLVQENLFLYVLVLAIFLLLHKEHRRRGLVLGTVALGAALIVFGVLQPLLRPETDLGYGFTHRYKDLLGESESSSPGMLALIWAVLTQPGKVIDLVLDPERMGVYRLFWRGIWFLPLWNPAGWILLIPSLENTLSSEGSLYLWSGHYAFGPVTQTCLAMVAALGLFRFWKPALSYTPAFSWTILFSAAVWGMKKSLLPYSIFMPAMHFGVAYEPPATQEILVTEIPMGQSVSAQSHLIPHLTHQDEIYLLPPGAPLVVSGDSIGDSSPGGFGDLTPSVGWPDYVAYNPNAAADAAWYNGAWFFDKEKVLDWCNWLVQSGRYRQVFPRENVHVPEGLSLIVLAKVKEDE